MLTCVVIIFSLANYLDFCFSTFWVVADFTLFLQSMVAYVEVFSDFRWLLMVANSVMIKMRENLRGKDEGRVF